MKYYIVRNGEPFGPLEKQDLLPYGVTEESLVWHEGLPQWVKAKSIPELADLFEESPFGAYTHVEQTAPAPPPAPQNIAHTNWLPWAIAATIVGFMFSCFGAIFGIIGIVQANKANQYYAEGMQIPADSANNMAKGMTIVGFVLAVIGFIGNIVMMLNGGVEEYMNMLNIM